MSGASGDSENDPTEAAFKSATEGQPQLPAIDFTTFVVSLSHSALVHFGDAPDPATGTRERSLPLARQSIDLLGLIQEKTRGNLNGGEERVLAQALYDLRMRYVEVAKSK